MRSDRGASRGLVVTSAKRPSSGQRKAMYREKPLARESGIDEER